MVSLIKANKTEWMKLRKVIIARDGGRCKKCGRTTGLEVHHITPVREDGSDEPENLITLCGVCHKEWEVFEDGMTTKFAEWLSIPQLSLLLAMYRIAGSSPDRTAGDLKAEVDSVHKSLLEGKGHPR